MVHIMLDNKDSAHKIRNNSLNFNINGLGELGKEMWCT